MNPSSFLTLLGSIDQTITDIDTISGKDSLTDSYLAKFLTVYISGMLEEAIENSLVDFFKRNTSCPELVTYAKETVNRNFQNPNSENIIRLISYFGNNNWASTLRAMHSEIIALNSIVQNKNNIAHGYPTTITLIDIKNFYLNSRPFIEKFNSLLT